MVLLGFKLLPDPHADEVRSLFEEKVFIEPKWNNLCKAQGITVQDTEWVQAVGAFKTAHNWVGNTPFHYVFFLTKLLPISLVGSQATTSVRVPTAFAFICNAHNRCHNEACDDIMNGMGDPWERGGQQRCMTSMTCCSAPNDGFLFFGSSCRMSFPKAKQPSKGVSCPYAFTCRHTLLTDLEMLSNAKRHDINGF